MQKLYLVGFTAALDGLIFSTRKSAKSGTFVVPLDGTLLKEIADAERRRDDGRAEEHRLSSPRLVRPESALSPREMQDRIRSGWSIDEVAAEAGVDVDWVRRFAAPILAEVRRVIDQASEIVYDKPRFGLSALPLGASVRRNVADRGVRMLDDELEEGWSAHQLDEDAWVVGFVYVSRGRPQEAEWLFDIGTGELSSRNRLGAQLGHVTRTRARVPRSVVPAATKSTKSARPAPKTTVPKNLASRAVVVKSVTRKKVAPRAVAPVSKKPSPTSAPRRQPVRPNPPVARTRPAPAVATRPAATPRKKATARPAKKPAEKHPDLEPPRPGAVVAGIARIDSRRTSRSVSAPLPKPVSRDAQRAGGPRPRRTEPLRGR